MEDAVLKDLAIPISQYLLENWDRHCTVVITCDRVVIVRDEIGIPLSDSVI